MSDKDKFNGSIDDLRSELGDCQDALQNLIFQKSLQSYFNVLIL